ncbi:MAG: c-type cytochrome domain-containing protein, partial [Bryobacteraceae bacterium]
MTPLLLLLALAPVDFKRDVAPVLARCQVCHGAQQQLSGLRLDSREAALAGGYAGPALVAGDSGSSRLIHLVAETTKGRFMPPAGDRLTSAQIATLRAWIDQGASWPATAPPLSVA